MRQVVRDMREPGAARPNSGDQVESLLHGLVHRVWLIAQRVEHQFVRAREQRLGFVGNAAEVGEVSEAADAEAQHGHVAVFGGNRRPGDAEQLEWPFDDVRSDLGNRAQDRLAVKDIRECRDAKSPAFPSKRKSGRQLSGAD